MLSEAEQNAAIEAIAAAAYDPREWPRALAWIAKAGEGWCAQLIGISGGGVQFHAAYGVTPEMTDEFDRRGGANPAINPRARVLARNIYALHRDRDLATPDELRRSELLHDFLYRDGGHDILGVRFPAIGQTNSCLVVSRNRAQLENDVCEDQYRLLLDATHGAMRLSAAVDGRGSELLQNALSGLRLTAFIVESGGRVVGLTPHAEMLAREGMLFRLTHSTLQAADHRYDEAFQSALAKACVRPDASCSVLSTTLMLRSLSGSREEVEVAAVPASGLSLRFGPVAIVVVKAKAEQPDTERLRRRFNFTNAETQVVNALLAGKSLADVAGERGVSLGTVRSQLKSIFAKADVRRQSQLVAIVHRELLRRT